MITLKGFPTEVSEFIELPDIAELLMYPFFYDTDVEDAYKYGSEFQKRLIEKVPLRKTKSSISILSQVKLLAPGFRSCTDYTEDPVHEWHIDCEEGEDRGHIYTEETDFVHLLSNKIAAMTEFNKNEITLDLPSDFPFTEFMKVIQTDLRNGNSFGIVPEKMPHNRIVTFTNHMHRATDSTGYEFRYLFRMVETDRKRKPGRYDPNVNESRIINGMGKDAMMNILRINNQIRIFIPQVSERYSSDGNDNSVSKDIIIPELEITHAGWELDLLMTDSPLTGFTPKNSIMLLGVGEFNEPAENDKLVHFFRNINTSITLVADDGHTIASVLRKDFYNHDDALGYIYGIHIILNSQDIGSMKDGIGYRIVPINNDVAKLKISEDIRIFKPDTKSN